MTKSHAFLFAAFVAIVALGLCSLPALAQDDDANLSNVHVTLSDQWVPGVTPQALSPVLAGPVAFVLPPPTVGPPPSWPCITPKAPCNADPAGGLLMGLPLQQWPISGATNCTLVPCGQIMALFQTTTGSGVVGFTVTVTQGSTTIFSKSVPRAAQAAAHQVGVVNLTGVQFAATAVAGPATITVTTSVGTTKVSGKTTIYLN